jgi:carbon dioxide concentrating mechanism protein CcmN
MQAPSLELISHTHYYRGGDVVIDPSAAIAPGTVLQALPPSSIRIEAGVCLGAGVVIQARGGALVVEAGASLGTSVLLVGAGKIGRNACIGPSSTLINPIIEAGVVIAPGSLWGDASRLVTPAPPAPESPEPVPPADIPPPDAEPPAAGAVRDQAVEDDSSLTFRTTTEVYGRNQVNSLINALFPHRQPLNSPQSGEDS